MASMTDFLEQFLGNRNRARIVRIFILNQGEPLTLRELGKRSGISTRGVSSELRALESLGIIRKGKNVPAPKKAWRSRSPRKQPASEGSWVLHQDFKHLRALSMFIKEVSPTQHRAILDTLKRAGRLAAVVLSGSFIGDPTRPADLLVAADGLNEGRLDQAIRILEPHYGHEIRYAAFSTPEFRYRLTIQDRLIRETLDYPHVVLLDRSHLL